MLLLLALALLGGPAGLERSTVLSGIRAIPDGDGVVITLQLSSPVTPSAARLLENPWRLYFDLPGVTVGRQRALPVGAAGVRQVRAALNQPAPAVTRVVIELDSRMQWTLTQAAPGEIQIRLARETQTPVVIDRRQQITADVRAMAPALDAIRTWAGPPESELAAMVRALDDLSSGARAMRSSRVPSDQLLVAAIDATMNAARARMLALVDNQPQSRANAIAAANGALLLLRELR